MKQMAKPKEAKGANLLRDAMRPNPPSSWRKAPPAPTTARCVQEPLRASLLHRLVHATLLAKQWMAGEVPDAEKHLLRLLALADERESGNELNACELDELRSLPTLIDELAQAEAKRWRHGLFSSVERAALRDLNAAARDRERQRHTRELLEQAKALALQEHNQARRHWQAGAERRKQMIPTQLTIAHEDARNVMEAHGEEMLDMAANGAVRHLQQGHALTCGEIQALRAKCLQRRVRRAAADASHPGADLRERLHAWQSEGEAELAQRLFGRRVSSRHMPNVKPPAKRDLDRATKRWLAILMAQPQNCPLKQPHDLPVQVRHSVEASRGGVDARWQRHWVAVAKSTYRSPPASPGATHQSISMPAAAAAIA